MINKKPTFTIKGKFVGDRDKFELASLKVAIAPLTEKPELRLGKKDPSALSPLSRVIPPRL
jgi:hypothetical protein